MAEALKLVTADESGRDRVITELERVIEATKAGEVTGILILTENIDEYKFSRTNMKLDIALGFLQRVMYRLNLEWDRVV